MNRMTLTEQIIETRIRKGISWADVARELGASKEWVTAACLGQMTFSKDQAEKIVAIFELSAEAVAVLEAPPHARAGGSGGGLGSGDPPSA
ncbi:hypothetical protein [Streptomyces sp. NPDC020298]|uniref:hypothetical protein n=1 Tax=unclassified Streptomyces TaxID=2593676 RepID=UPI0033D933BB